MIIAKLHSCGKPDQPHAGKTWIQACTESLHKPRAPFFSTPRAFHVHERAMEGGVVSVLRPLRYHVDRLDNT